MNIKLKIRTGVSRFLAFFSPGWGSCGRCERTWNVTKSHSTQYTPTWGCFPLCEKCWGELSPEERLPFYRGLWVRWEKEDCPEDNAEGQQEWALIKKAVLGGK
jgi:hypothetical protein